jgi:OHCU decarboxylase
MQPIEALNTSGPDAFADGVKPLFETAPPLARALYAARPYASYAVLIDTAESLARSMPLQEQVAVLSAHPRIGASPATLSAASSREQASSAESGMDPGELRTLYTELADLNDAYEQRFGFRFVVFVNGRSKSEIVGVLRDRLERTRDEELETGLRDMFLIARARLATTA